MRKPRFRQSMEVFENMLREKELILYGTASITELAEFQEVGKAGQF